MRRSALFGVTRWRQRILGTLVVLLVFMAGPSARAFDMNPVPDAATQTSEIRQYVDNELRQEQLRTTARFRPLTADELAELESLKEKIHKTWNFYYFSKARDSFNKRADALLRNELGPARRQWVEDLFPTAQQVAAAYPDTTDRLIALTAMRDELLRSNGDWSDGKAAVYDLAIKAIKDEERRKGVELGSDGLTVEQRTLMRHATEKIFYDEAGLDFRHQLYARFIPGDVPKVAALQADKHEELSRPSYQLALIGIAAITLLLSLILPRFLLPKRLPKPRLRPGEFADGETAGFNLPESLSTIHLERLEYPVTLETGRIVADKTLVRHNVQHHHAGTGTVGDPYRDYSSTTITSRDRVWIRTIGNKEIVWTFGIDLLSRVENMISILSTENKKGDTIALMVYNHSIESLEDLSFQQFKSVQKLSVFKLWLTSIVIGAIGGVVAIPTVNHLSAGRTSPAVIVLLMAGAAAVVGGIGALYVKLRVQSRRNRVVRREYLPAYRSFFVAITPELQSRFG